MKAVLTVGKHFLREPMVYGKPRNSVTVGVALVFGSTAIIIVDEILHQPVPTIINLLLISKYSNHFPYTVKCGGSTFFIQYVRRN